MPRLPRVYIEDTLYYVSAKGGHNQTVFLDPTDYKDYIDLIDKYKKQYGFKLFAYVLLPTHLHMIIEVRNNIGISNIMHDINSLYTKMHNSRYKKKGHLFEARFKSVFAQKEIYLLPLIRHIHLNPMREGLVKDPADYEYSSYGQFLSPQKRLHPDLSKEIEESFTLLKGKEDAFALYMRAQDEKDAREFKKHIQKKRILGSKEFVARIKNIIEEEKIKQQRRRHLTRKMRMIFVSVVCALIILTTFTVDYFYRQRKTLETEYEKTLTRYQATLNMLKRQRDKAAKAEQDIENYQWKIELVEQALESLKKEREKELRAIMAIEGYQWRIRLTQIGGQKIDHNSYDLITITPTHVSSSNLSREGFGRSRYSKRQAPGGSVVWETIQTSSQGDQASWRGEWDGKVMKGVLRRSFKDGKVADFSFESIGERMEI